MNLSGLGASIASLGIFLGALAYENLSLTKAKKNIKIKIQVNGTRGKSETARLLHGALSNLGYRTLGKTTGTVPMWLFPDGSTEPVKRIAGANIQEQYKAVKKASKMGCDALVVECMAIKPELQKACGRIVSPDITVITNAYPDHMDEIGSTEIDTISTLALSIPENSKCVFGELSKDAEEVFRGICKRAGAKPTKSSEIPDFSTDTFSFNAMKPNVEAVLKTLEVLGLDRGKGLEGMKKVKPEIGSFRYCEVPVEGGKAILANAFAANDVISTRRLLERVKKERGIETVTGLFNAREDRLDRTLQFAELMKTGGFGRLLFIGKAPSKLSRKIEFNRLKNVEELSKFLKDGEVVFGFGNIKNLTHWLEGLEVHK